MTDLEDFIAQMFGKSGSPTSLKTKNNFWDLFTGMEWAKTIYSKVTNVLSDVSGWITTNIKSKTDNIFALGDITSWIQTNIIGKTDLLSNTWINKIFSLSDVTSWITDFIRSKTDLINETWISKIFSLDDISTWITSNLKNKTDLISNTWIDKVFSLTDISNWITNNLKNKTDLIFSLTSLTDWLTAKFSDFAANFSFAQIQAIWFNIRQQVVADFIDWINSVLEELRS